MANPLEDMISGIIRERFTDAVIDSISVEPDDDSDGDPILKITVVFGSEIAKLETGKLASLTRHIRPKLLENKENGFPIFRIMSKHDSDRQKHEAA